MLDYILLQTLMFFFYSILVLLNFQTSVGSMRYVLDIDIIPWKVYANDFYSFVLMHQKIHLFASLSQSFF